MIRRGRECFYTYIISLYHGGDIKHFKIKKNSSEKSTTFALESDESRPFSSLSLLIEHYKHCKVKCKFLIIILTTISQFLFLQWQRDFSLRLATFDHQLEDRWGQTNGVLTYEVTSSQLYIGKMELLFHQFEQHLCFFVCLVIERFVHILCFFKDRYLWFSFFAFFFVLFFLF